MCMCVCMCVSGREGKGAEGDKWKRAKDILTRTIIRNIIIRSLFCDYVVRDDTTEIFPRE